MKKQPPHSFTLFGKKWKVKFVDPRKQGVFERPHKNLMGLTYKSRKLRDIYIHPRYRGYFNVFAHELLHALTFEMMGRERGWKKWRSKKLHDLLDELSFPLGQYLKENLQPDCRCQRKGRK